MEARIDADLGCGRAAELVSELESLTHEHPLRERFTAQLMTALYRSGRQADALRRYQSLRSRLVEDLGVEPSADLRALEGRILAEDADLAGRTAVTTAVTAPEPGLAVRGYEIRERIISGPVGGVHRAFQPSIGREVAITVVPSEFADDPAFVRRFEADGRAVAALEHPHVVPLYDYWREPGTAYLVNRLMASNLRSIVETSALDVERASVMFDEIASALDVAHRRGIVHGDVRTESVLFDDEGAAYLSGFGLGGHRSGADGATLAPELVGGVPPTPASDVFALATVVAHALTGLSGSYAQIEGALDEPLASVLAAGVRDDPAQRPTAIALARRFAEAVGRTEPAAEPPPGPIENPFRGLASFDVRDADVFHGRERVIERLVGRMASPGAAGRFVAVVGPSGSGKSSVVKAGLLPALDAGYVPGATSWFVTTMTPGRQPFEALEAALLRVAIEPPPTLYEQLTAGENGLRRAARRILPDDDSQLVLVIDQFEELFTLADPAIAETFLDGLAGAVGDDRGRVRIVVTLRADFYDGPLRHRSFGELLREGTEVITPMSAEEIEVAITKPVEPLGVTFAPAVVAQIGRDVVGRPGALPLMQYALTELFDQRTGPQIGTETYRRIGGVSGALASRAASLLDDGLDRDAVRQVFLRLVTLGEGAHDTRRRALRSELEDLELPKKAIADVIDRFASHRLLTLDRDPLTRGPTVEIAHEALLSEWSTLREWIDGARDDVRNQRRLSAAAADWTAADESDTQLLTGGPLDRLAGWAAASQLRLSEHERRFLDRSIAARDRAREEEQEREQLRVDAEQTASRRLKLIGAATALAVVVGALAVVALLQAQAAQRSEDELAATLRSQDLAAASVLQLQTDLDLAGLLALEAAAATAGFGVITPEAADALHWVIQEANVVYPVTDDAQVAVRPGPSGATGVYVLPPAQLAELVRASTVGRLDESQCAEFGVDPCEPAGGVPADVVIQGGDDAYGATAQGPGALAGTKIELLHAFGESDIGLALEMARFEDETGIVLSIPAFENPGFELDRRPGDREPLPDLMFWAQPAQLVSFDVTDMIDLSSYIDVDQLGDDVGPRLLSLATVGPDGEWPSASGQLLGLPNDVDIKGLVYYPRAKFEAAGYEVPESWDELIALSDRMVADGRTPWCFFFESGAGSGWPGTDLIETLVLRGAGVEVYDQWTRHEIPFDHPEAMTAALRAEQLLLTPGYARGGADSISRFSFFGEGAAPLLTDDPQCWLYHQADFLGGLLPAGTQFGVDIDVFPFPPITAGDPISAIGGGNLLSAFGDRPEVREFVRYVAEPTWGERWAGQGSNFISANKRFDVSAYGANDPAAAGPRQTVGVLARDAIAADTFRFDASDLMPAAIGSAFEGERGAFWVGMIDVVDGRRTMTQVMADIEIAWQQLESGSEPATTGTVADGDGASGADYASFSEADVVAAGQQLFDAYNRYDQPAFRAATAVGYEFVDERGSVPRDVQISLLPEFRDQGLVTTDTGPWRVSGEGPFVAEVDQRLDGDIYDAEGRNGTSILTIVLEDGKLKVLEHRYEGEPL